MRWIEDDESYTLMCRTSRNSQKWWRYMGETGAADWDKYSVRQSNGGQSSAGWAGNSHRGPSPEHPGLCMQQRRALTAWLPPMQAGGAVHRSRRWGERGREVPGAQLKAQVEHRSGPKGRQLCRQLVDDGQVIARINGMLIDIPNRLRWPNGNTQTRFTSTQARPCGGRSKGGATRGGD